MKMTMFSRKTVMAALAAVSLAFAGAALTSAPAMAGKGGGGGGNHGGGGGGGGGGGNHGGGGGGNHGRHHGGHWGGGHWGGGFYPSYYGIYNYYEPNCFVVRRRLICD